MSFNMSPITPLDIAPISGNKLSPAQLAKVVPEYAELHNKNAAGKARVHERPPGASKSTGGSYLPGALRPVPVGKEEEILVPRKYTAPEYPPIPIVVYTPVGSRPENGWPMIYNIHGGGWVLGSKTSEESINTRYCAETGSVVVSPEYRLAPDHPYPAAIEDCWEVLMWLWEQGPKSIDIDVNKFLIGGASAGGHLSATMINMLQEVPYVPKDLKFILNLSIVPVTDNTAGEAHLGSPTWDAYPSWTKNADGPSLEKSKMLWYRNLFIPNIDHRTDWHASPMLAPDEFWSKHPPTFVGVAGADVLKDEGIAYANRLKAAGVKVDLRIYEGLPHPGVMMAEAIPLAKQFQEDMYEAARKAIRDN